MKRVLALLAVATLTACGGGGGTTAVAPPTTVAPPAVVAPPSTPIVVAPPQAPQVVTKQGCQTQVNPAKVNTSFNGYTMLSNTWNAKVASTYSTCVDVVIDSIADVTHAVFNWSATLIGRVDVVAYPNIYVGWLLDIPNNSTVLPIPVTSNKNIVATGKISTTCPNTSCLYQNIFDIFFSNSATSNIRTHELGVMTSYKVDWSFGTPAYTTVVDNAVYSVYTMPITSPNTGESWTMITYVPAVQIVNLNINLSHIIADSVAHGLLRSTEYTTMVGLGTEVISGTGTTNISNFQININ